ncbi:MAG: MFS transporter [Chloroflexi bacterium]|nr:MFS transporter [Chloroflexota bacterium]
MSDAPPHEVPASVPPTASPYRWVMLALICLAYGAFGMVQASISPLITPILADTGMTRGEMGIALGSWQFVYLFVAIPAGALIDRFGLRRAIFFGIAVIALSGLLRAGAVNQVTMLAAVMVFGLGGPFISIGAPKLTATWFGDREVGMALGIYTVSQSIGAMVATALANSLIMPATGDSWRATLLIFAGVCAVTAVAWVVLAREPRGTGAKPATGPGAMLASFRGLLRVPLVQLVLVMAVGVFLFNHSFTNWLPEMLRSRGMSASAAGYWASMPTLVAIVAALVVPRFTTARWLTPVLIAVFGMWMVAALLLRSTGGGLEYLALVMLGIGRGAATPLLMLTLMRSRSVGSALMGAAGGLFFTAGEVGGVLGPTLTGFLSDATGGFGAGLLALAVTSAVLAAMALALRPASEARARPA